MSLYIARNDKRNSERKSISNIIDKCDMEVAENLLNIAEEDIMLDYRVVERCRLKYSHIIREVDMEFSWRYPLTQPEDSLKGKAKKEAEKNNEDLGKKTLELSELIDNFTEIICEEKIVKKYMAQAIAWESVQRKTIEY